jgi:type II secretory pathway pseudopilin PulG
MSTHQNHGFTVIEISLFVAISGLLAVGLLTGWSVAINSQRYKDSVDSLYAYMQQQYSFAYDVENGRKATLSCDSNSVIHDNGSTPRGQSDCVLLGRYIRITNGSQFESFAVVGNEASDSNSLSSYEPKVVEASIGLSQAEFTIPWQAVATGNGDENDSPLNIGIAILRSPSTGTVYTYVNSDTGNVVDLSIVVSPENQKEQYFCVDPGKGITVQGQRRAVYLPRYAASLNSVETLGSDNGC